MYPQSPQNFPNTIIQVDLTQKSPAYRLRWIDL
jgi:hypothetical protein